jgi:hypothetical protein
MDEKRRLLELISTGKITAEEGLRLIKALGRQPTPKPRQLCLVVQRGLSEKPLLNLCLPMELLKLAPAELFQGFSLHTARGLTRFDFKTIDWQELVRLAAAGETGELLHLEISESDGRVTLIRITAE